ncbi:MAG: Flagellar motor switch protein FliM [Frankiales bacterium]|nr:Flagellar motor switch protein FliM [Frankiales bacterium]
MPPAQLFDFRDPLPMPAGAARLVAAVTDAAPRVGLLLGLACGRNVPVSCPGVRRVALVEVASPAAVWSPLSCGLPDPGLLLVPADVAVALADLYLGGMGEGEARPCTPLEQQLLIRHTLPALRPLAEALADHGVTGLTAGPISDDPLPVGGGEVVAIPLDLELPLGMVVRLTVCLPAKSLLPSVADAAPPIPTHAAEAVLGDVPIEISFRLAATIVTAEDVEDLAPGDIIRLDPEAPSQLVGVLAGDGDDLPTLAAALGRRGRRRAVVVHAPVGAPQSHGHDGGL